MVCKAPQSVWAWVRSSRSWVSGLFCRQRWLRSKRRLRQAFSLKARAWRYERSRNESSLAGSALSRQTRVRSALFFCILDADREIDRNPRPGDEHQSGRSACDGKRTYRRRLRRTAQAAQSDSYHPRYLCLLVRIDTRLVSLPGNDRGTDRHIRTAMVSALARLAIVL